MARPFADFQRLDAVQAPLPDLMEGLQRHLDACIGLDSLVVHWYDADGAMRDFYADAGWPAPSVQDYLADYETHRDPYTRNAQARMAGASAFALGRRELERRPVHDRVLRPLGLDAVLNVPVQAHGLRAIVGCARSGRRQPFGAAELRSVARLQPGLRALLGARAVSDAVLLQQPGAALLLLRPDGEIVQACANGRRILALLQAAEHGRAWEQLRLCLQRALMEAQRPGGQGPVLRLQLSEGRYLARLRALAALQGDAQGLVAVELTRLVSREARFLALARRHGWSRRELQIALGLQRGDGLETIAAGLGIAATSVKTLSRSLYGRVGVGDRADFARWVDQQEAAPPALPA